MREGQEKGSCGGGGLGPWEGKTGKERDGRRESNRQTRGRWEGRRGKEGQGARGRRVKEGYENDSRTSELHTSHQLLGRPDSEIKG